MADADLMAVYWAVASMLRWMNEYSNYAGGSPFDRYLCTNPEVLSLDRFSGAIMRAVRENEGNATDALRSYLSGRLQHERR
jgi:hypothetical protein